MRGAVQYRVASTPEKLMRLCTLLLLAACGAPDMVGDWSGDLDCDEDYSTFEMYGVVKDGEPQGSPSMYRENETE